ncbi:uncharacterized protein LOC100398008 isoform X4 [Callithrix jacchus]
MGGGRRRKLGGVKWWRPSSWSSRECWCRRGGGCPWYGLCPLESRSPPTPTARSGRRSGRRARGPLRPGALGEVLRRPRLQNPCPESSASVLSRINFWWITGHPGKSRKQLCPAAGSRWAEWNSGTPAHATEKTWIFSGTPVSTPMGEKRRVEEAHLSRDQGELEMKHVIIGH